MRSLAFILIGFSALHASGQDFSSQRIPSSEQRMEWAKLKKPARKTAGCCKICATGTAPCGNGCISRKKVCRKPVGCACDS